MASKQTFKNAALIEQLTTQLRQKIEKLRAYIAAEEIQKLDKENAELERECDRLQATLISAEKLNGKKQFTIPNAKTVSTDDNAVAGAKDAEKKSKPQASKAAKVEASAKPEGKAKAPKEKSQAKESNQQPKAEEAVCVSQLDLRVGLIKGIQKHPDADALYVEDIDLGEPQIRKVVSGLVKFVPINEMENRMVVVMCNLKPAKMRGVVSEGMVMCASTPDKVEPIRPPKGCKPGDTVMWQGLSLENYPKPESVLNPKKKIWERIAPDLKIDASGKATWMGKPLVIGGENGFITTDSLKDVQIK